jgi:hypothetical protein
MALSNENSPQLVVVPMGSITADGSLPALYLPKKSFIKSVTIIDVTGIAASDTNYIQVSLQNGSDVIAEMDSRAAHEGALTALVGLSLNMVAAEQEQAAGSSLKVVYNEEGTVAMTNAILVVELYPL